LAHGRVIARIGTSDVHIGTMMYDVLVTVFNAGCCCRRSVYSLYFYVQR
jgi:hypothetical protein